MTELYDEGIPSKCACCEGVEGATQHTLTGRCRYNPSQAAAGFRTLGGTTFFDGGSVKVRNHDGFVHVECHFAAVVVGYAVSVNGRSLPLTGDGGA